jgi:hydroxymethylglutaryl-CoA lyase
MQGLPNMIPTVQKIAYINQLLQVGFDTVDFGSFVSPKAIPQMSDTAQVFEGLDLDSSRSRLLAIVANVRGALIASDLKGIDCLGFPLSISETFQLRNTNKTIKEALITVEEIQDICKKNHMTLVTYLSMGFGNPYGDPYNPEIVSSFVEKLAKLEVEIVSLADTIGVSHEQNIRHLFQALIPAYPHIEFGAHLHAHPNTALGKINAAYQAGCRRFDGALKGFGGCPMADDSLVGNIDTETLIYYLQDKGYHLSINRENLKKALQMVPAIFQSND